MLEIVKASAGAGKTYTLANRFLQHLARAKLQTADTACLRNAVPDSYAWNEILAITFTNKAAAEMQQRVLGALKLRALGQGADGLGREITPDDAARWVQTLLQRLGNLNIRTIDSLLNQVMRLGALQLGLAPDVELEFSASEIFAPLYAEFVAEAEAGEEPQQSLLQAALDATFRLHGCSQFLPNASFQDSLLKTFTFMLQLPPDADELADPDALQQLLKSLYSRFHEAAQHMADLVERDKLSASKHFANYLGRSLACGLYEDPYDSTMAAKPELAACLLKKSHSSITPEAEAAYTRLKQAHQDFASLAAPLRTAQSLAHLSQLCKRLLHKMPELLATRGITPAAQLPHKVRQLLADELCCNEALCRMGNRLAYLLIDEFQDTSRLQWAALKPLAVEALSRGGGLFYVGDVKQAIYRWRGGDASLFDEVPEQFEIKSILSTPALVENLPNNWRSSEDLVQRNNDFFSQLENPAVALSVAEAMLGPKAPENVCRQLAENIVSVYGDSHQNVAPRNVGKRGFVQLEPVVAANKEELYELVRTRLREILLNDLGLDDNQPKVAARDVAILVRKNDQAAEVARWCLEFGVNVVTENSLMLREHPLVQQMTALLAFLDYPDNNLAFWDAVSGEHLLLDACELTADELHAWLAARGKGPLYRRFQQAFPEVWQHYLEPLFLQAGFMSAYDVLCDITARFQLLERFPQEELFLRRLLETAHVAEAQGALSLAAFLDLWNQTGDEQKVPLPENLDAVRVLTIHKAKGLEFPIVVMPFHHADAKPKDDLTAWPPPGLDRPALAKLSPKLGDTYYREALPQLLEQLNLLYVGWTRAERGLYCLLTATGRYRGSSPLLQGLEVLLQKAGISLAATEQEINSEGVRRYGPSLDELAPDLAGKRVQAGDKEAETPPRRPPLPLNEGLGQERMPMAWLPRLNIYRSALDEENFAARKRGTLAHRCLEYLQATDDAEHDVRMALRAGMRGHADPHDPAAFAEDNPELETDLSSMLTWARQHPELAPLLQSGRGEQELLTPEGAIRRVDFLARDDQQLVAVEYKTGGKEPEHHRQLQQYLDLLAGLPDHGRPAPRGLLVYLDLQQIETVGG